MATLLEYQEYLDELDSRAQLREDDERRGLRLDASERWNLLLGKFDLSTLPSDIPTLLDNEITKRLEFPLAIGRGVIGAVHETAEGLASIDEWLNDKLDMGAIVFGDNASNGVIGFASGQQDFDSIFDLTSQGFGTINDFIPEPTTGVGGFVEGLSRWVAGFYTGGKVINAATAAPKAFTAAAGINIGKWRTIAAIVKTMRWTGKGALAGAFSDLFTTNIEHGNLSNLVEGTIAENPVSRLLAIDADDSELEARLKTVAEGGIAGVAIEGVLRGSRVVLMARRVAREKAAAKKLEAEKKFSEDRELDELNNLSDDLPAEEFRPQELTPEDFGFLGEDAKGIMESPATTLQDANFQVRTNKEGRMIITALSRGKGSNHIVLQTTGDVVQVVEVYVDKGSRNQGIGASLYEVAIDHVLKSGKRFASSNTLLEPGYRRWVALKEAGYVVVENTDVNVQSPTGNAFRGRTVTRDGSPIFEITGRTDKVKGPNINLKLIPKDITASTTDAQVIADTLGEHIANAGMTVEQIVEQLAKTGDLSNILGRSGNVGRLGAVNFRTIDWESFGGQTGDVQRILALYGDGWDKVLANESRTTLEEVARRASKITTDDVMGDSGVQLLSDLRKDGGLAGRVLATQQLLLESSSRIASLARQMLEGQASEGVRRELIRQNLMHRHLYAVASGASHEVGLTMRSMQILKKHNAVDAAAYADILRELRIDPDNIDLLKQLASFSGAANVSQALQRSAAQKWWAVTLEVLYGNLLSSPATLTANLLGNIYKLARSFADPIAGIAVSAGRRAVGGGPTQSANFIELQANFFGLFAGIHDSMYFSIRIIRQGLDETGGVRALLHKPGRTQLTEYLVERKAIGTLYEAVATGNPVTSASGRGIPRERAIVMEIPSPEEFHNRAMKGLLATATEATGRLVVNRLGNAIRFFPGSIMAIDEIFKTIAHRQSIYADAFRLAEVQRRIPGREGHVLGSRFSNAEEFIAASFKDIEAQATAVEFAQAQTFQGRGGKFMQGVETLVNDNSALRIILPFIRTPGNLFVEAFTTLGGPIQLLMKNNRAILKAGSYLNKTATPIQRARADKLLGQAVIATTITGTVIAWALDGRIVGRRGGSGALDGVAPNSIRFGDKWFTYNRLDPLGMVVGLVGEFVEGSQEALEEDEGAWEGVFVAAMTAIMNNAASKTWLQGLSDLVLMMDDPERYGSSWYVSVGANLIPFAGSSLRRRWVATEDPYAREVFTAMDRLAVRGTLGRRQDLAIRRDSLGVPIKDDSSLLGIIRETELTTDPLRLALADLDYALPRPSKSVKDVPLTGHQYSRLLELRGQTEMGGTPTMELALRRLVLSDEFSLQYDEAKIELIRALVSRYTSLAKKVLESEDEVLRSRIIVERINKQNLLAIQ